MPIIPLPKGARGLENSPKQIDYLKNLYYSGGERENLLFRPSVTGLVDGYGPCRGMGRFNIGGEEILYSVSSDRLIKIEIITGFPSKELTAADIQVTADPTFIANSGEKCHFASSYTYMAVLVEGGNCYIVDASGVIVKTYTDGVDFYKASVSVTEDSGRFVFVPADGGPIFWTNTLDAKVIDVANYADAEIQPDPNKAVIARKGSIFVLGSRTVQELDYSPAQNVYAAVSGSAVSVGYVGGLTKYGESFAFLGQGENGNFGFYVMGQGVQPIYNETISEQLNNNYSLADLENIRGQHFTWKGVTLLLFYLPDLTLCYYGDWASWHSTGLDIWRVNNIEYAYGYLFTGDSTTHDIGFLQDKGIDYGIENQWEFRTGIRSEPQTNFLLSKICVQPTVGVTGIVGGQNTHKEGNIALSISTDGRIFNGPFWKTLGDVGDYNKEIWWGKPLIRCPDYCAIIVKGYGDALVNTDGLSYDV